MLAPWASARAVSHHHDGSDDHLLVAAEVFFDLLQVFSLGRFIVGQLRPTASELTQVFRLVRRGHLAYPWSPRRAWSPRFERDVRPRSFTPLLP
jgi:hypothetical protein